MKTLKYLLTSLIYLIIFPSFSQNAATLRGSVTDYKTGEDIPFANVIIKTGNGIVEAGGTTDAEGLFVIKPISPGIYNIECFSIGYAKATAKGVELKSGVITVQDFRLREETAELEEVVITYQMPLIDKNKSSKTVGAEDIHTMAVRDVTSVAAQAAGVAESTEIRGSRTEGTVYFIDGVKVLGSTNMPQGAVEQQRVITGGLPAQYGDHPNPLFEYPQDPGRQAAPKPVTRAQNPYPSRESYAPIEEIPFKAVDYAPLSTFSSDVDVASYANIRRFINDGQLPPPAAVRIEEMINYFTYDYPEPGEGEVFSMTTELGECPWKKNHQLLRIGIKTPKFISDDSPDNNLVFLIDVSGSMGSPDKLPLLKKSLKLLVNNLRESDRVAIVVYAGAAGVVLEPTKGTDKQKILNAIKQLSSGGSTAGGAGIELAYKLAEENFRKNDNNRVILATDGDFNVGMSSDQAMVKLIEEKRELGVFLTVLGFGTGNLQDSKMEKIADHGNGNYAYIDNLMEAQKVLVNEMGSTLHTVAKDTKFQIEFNPAEVAAYRLIGYENRILRDEDFNDDTKDAGDVGSGHAVTAVYEIIPVGAEVEISRPSIDPLKYQQQTLLVPASQSGELATLKIRYKKPDEDTSVLRSQVVSSQTAVENTNDFLFICAIMEFGMILRDSEYKGNSSYSETIALAQAGKGTDPNGYRGEFIRMIDLADKLDVRKSVGMR